ncbi:unnamed protein product [Oppiella nova]|uniref:Uncharacterized protein n=1 Tax=Oppiella nova TaxID=334625 RepID=A0A7R9LGM6_9ACAR|nr:unnamed protein product [Oppiella nova]CAG2163402.1 unnamed protein product [Oppiella nova]
MLRTGSNTSGCLGLGHNNEVKTLQIIPQLSNKKIQQFINGYDFVLAINDMNHVFSWGHNDCGQLGRHTKRLLFLKTEYGNHKNISELNDKNITQICCGYQHSLALNTNGRVYAWGWNKWGQIGNNTDISAWTPFATESVGKLDGNCCHRCGTRFAWFHRKHRCHHCGQLFCDKCWAKGSTNPKYGLEKWFCDECYDMLSTAAKPADQIPIEGLSISSAQSSTYSGLNRKGSENKRLELALSQLEVESKDCMKMSRISNIMDKTSNVSSELGNNSFENNYINLFEELSTIGSGAFGKVYKVKHRFDEHIYAVKRILLNDSCDNYMKRILNEVKNLGKVRSEYCVHYYNSWPESKHLYIQMEFCSQNLRNILEMKPKILESVQYLHELNPQIIHRDLKPENTLIAHNVRNGRFVKLCDFGLATVHENTMNYNTYDKHTTGVGTTKYQAPEIAQGKAYGHKVDIYSLAIIGSELIDFDLFYFDPDNSESIYSGNEILNTKVKEFQNILQSMMLTPKWSQRPECSEVLAEYNEWSIDRNILANDPRFESTLSSSMKSHRVRMRGINYLTVDGNASRVSVLSICIYCMGYNQRGCLGLGHDIEVKTPQIIPQLCNQRIQQFINGNDFVLAINDLNHVFSGGHNDWGQLGRHYGNYENISQLNDKNITQISCGSFHSLVLTTNGQVYAWGNNDEEQIVSKVGNKLFESHYQNLFQELSAIGSGGFGTVFKVKRRFDEHIYAVKIIKLKDFSDEYMKSILKEVKNLLSVRSEYCVQYYNSWPESKHLYIQMEFCSQNLRNILEIKPKVFDRQLGDAMNCVEYYISCEIFRQILESVQYLHELNPQIIHRDLKPDNILITDNVRNGRFVKLCDFGLAVEHRSEYQSHSNNKGTPKYMAPELYQSKYTTKADIYSLGIISMELFGIYLVGNELAKYDNTIGNNKSNIIFVTNNDSVYGLGGNASGCLGLGHNNEVKTPQIIPQLCNQRIHRFINGWDFVLAINHTNQVFGWGGNYWGQSGRHETQSEHSMALTTDGQVYGWGRNSYGQIGNNTKCAQIWAPIELRFDNKHKIKTNIKSVEDNIGLIKAEVYKVPESEERELSVNLTDNITAVSSKLENYTFNSHYESLFIELSAIGSGGFGTVFKVKHRFDEHIYAVKRIEFKKSSDEYMKGILMEVKKLRKLNPDFVVQYITSWPENKHLFIQMEFCSQNLRNILDIKPKVFNRQSGVPMDCVEYYISCVIFRQILESVQYLHELNPQIIHRDLKPENILIAENIRNGIIHRDLKPENILIAENIRNGRFVKLCDFGLAVEHRSEYQSHSKNKGTPKYMAPELYQSKYTTKADIYSLGIISMELFDIFLDGSELDKYIDNLLHGYVANILPMFNTMVSFGPIIRPRCNEILNMSDKWSLSKDIIHSNISPGVL